ncbi:MAG: sulfate transporter [Planctomycetaceae bacterium]|nr:sulfate transporter [Planctomycetaceae bacterium]
MKDNARLNTLKNDNVSGAWDDVLAGVVVFLVALPLCIGIALASNAPPLAGVVAGIVAGLIVGPLSGAQVTISGPAAGLTAVVAAEISAIGSFEGLLVAVALAGVIQIALGILRGGFIKSFVPASVVRGLLSAIGVILILKQIPHLFGHDTDPEGEMSFFQPDRQNTFSELFEILGDLHPGSIVVGFTSLAIIYLWGRIAFLKKTTVPVPLVVVIFGVVCGLCFDNIGGNWIISTTHKVNVPVPETIRGFFGLLHNPDFSQIMNPAVSSAAFAIALVGSLQALLTLEAVDRLDREKRSTSANRELVAQGIGNIVSGMAGGLPMTCEIVRSSVNIDAGARTKKSAILHGALLAISVVLLPQVINLIPLSALAAILIATGLKLASPQVVAELWRAGKYQFVPWFVTLLAIVLTDPLIGILIGLAVSTIFILWSNLRRPMRLVVERHLGGDVTRIELASQVSFLNRAALRKTFDTIDSGKHLLVDAHDTVYIDPDILSLIKEYRDVIGPARGVRVSTRGFRDKYAIKDRIEFVDFSSRELQEQITPEEALSYLLAGNQRFRNERRLKRDFSRQARATASSQHPMAVVLSCIDSRTPPEIIFDLGLGDIFSVRVAGNIVTPEVLGSIEFGCVGAGAKLIVVVGHNRCVAVQSAIDFMQEKQDPELNKCEYVRSIVQSLESVLRDSESSQPVNTKGNESIFEADIVVRQNVQRSVNEILQKSASIFELVHSGQVGIIGIVYDVTTGVCHVMDETSRGLGETSSIDMQRQ